MTPLQNIPGKIVGADRSDRTITVQIPVWSDVTMGDSVIMSSVPEIAPRVGDVDREAAVAITYFLTQQFPATIGNITLREKLETAFARHRENATR